MTFGPAQRVEAWNIENAIVRLKNNCGGEAWELFLRAVDKVLDDVTATVINAGPGDDIRIKQGHAQMAKKYKQWFYEAKSP